MFIIRAIRTWIESWILFFWVIFIRLISSEAVTAIEENIIYIDEDRFPVKRKSLDGRDDYLRVVESAGEIRKHIPKKEPLKRTRSSGSVNSLIGRFEKRSKSVDHEDQDIAKPIRVGKRLEPLPVVTANVSNRVSNKTKTIEANTGNRKDEPSPKCDDTDQLWNLLVAQYVPDEKIKQVAHLKGQTKEPSLDESCNEADQLLEKYLSRIDPEPAELEIQQVNAATCANEIEAHLEKAINDGESNGEDRIFIMFEDSNDDSDGLNLEDQLQEIVTSKSTEDNEGVSYEASGMKIPSVSSLVSGGEITSELDDRSTEVQPAESLDANNSESICADKQLKTSKPKSTINIVVKSVVCEPCLESEAKAIQNDKFPDVVTVDDEFDTLWKNVKPVDDTNIDDLYNECLANHDPNHLGGLLKCDASSKKSLPNTDGRLPKQNMEQVPILKDLKGNESNAVNASKKENILHEVIAASEIQVPNVDKVKDGVNQEIESALKFTNPSDSNERIKTVVNGDCIELDNYELSDEETSRLLGVVENRPNVVIVDAEDDGLPTMVNQQSSEQAEEKYISTIANGIVIEVPDLLAMEDSEMLVSEGELNVQVDEVEEYEITDENLELEIEEVLSKLASQQPQKNGLMEAFSVADEDVKEDLEMITHFDEEDDIAIESGSPIISVTLEESEVHRSSPTCMQMEFSSCCIVEDIESSSPTSEDQVVQPPIDLRKVARKLSVSKLRDRFSLADIPEEQEPSESIAGHEDYMSELSDDCFESNIQEICDGSAPTNGTLEDVANVPEIPTFLHDVKDLLVPKARRKKQRRFKELDEIMKVDVDKLKPRQNIFASREDLTQLDSSESSENGSPRPLSPSDTVSNKLDTELFTEEERLELAQIENEQRRHRAAQKKELEKYLQLPSALTDQEHQELAELIAEEESERKLDELGEVRLQRFLDDVRKRMEEQEPVENDLNHYMNLPLHLTNEEQEMLETEDNNEKSRADFETDEDYKEYIKQKYLDDLEAERLQVEQEFCYSDYSESFDSEEEYEYEDNPSLLSSSIPNHIPSARASNTL